MKERRSQPKRIQTDVVVDYRGTHVVLFHKVVNLSIGGICIQSPSVEPVGKSVSLSLNFPELNKALEVSGVVVWTNEETPSDMGIRFTNLSESDIEVIRNYIALVEKKG